MESVKSDVSYLEVNSVFSGEPVDLLEKSIMWTGLKGAGHNTWKELLCFL